MRTIALVLLIVLQGILSTGQELKPRLPVGQPNGHTKIYYSSNDIDTSLQETGRVKCEGMCVEGQAIGEWTFYGFEGINGSRYVLKGKHYFVKDEKRSISGCYYSSSVITGERYKAGEYTYRESGAINLILQFDSEGNVSKRTEFLYHFGRPGDVGSNTGVYLITTYHVSIDPCMVESEGKFLLGPGVGEKIGTWKYYDQEGVSHTMDY